jgi:hypothetical protein
MYTINKLANPFVLMSIQQGTKCCSLVKQSTTTYIALQLFNQGRPLTISIDISGEGPSGIGRWHNTPNSLCQLSFIDWQVR